MRDHPLHTVDPRAKECEGEGRRIALFGLGELSSIRSSDRRCPILMGKPSESFWRLNRLKGWWSRLAHRIERSYWLRFSGMVRERLSD